MLVYRKTVRARRLVAGTLLALALPAAALAATMTQPVQPTQPAQPTSRLFPETGKTVRGSFLDYWNTHGALPQQGYPISGELQEKSDTDGKTYTVQYFERAVFELHPENKAPNDVLLSLLGNFLYKQKYPGGASNQQVDSTPGFAFFPITGHRIGGKFLDYWKSHGGLAQQGYPISEEFPEKSDLDGKTYQVQYFERAVFEHHPENKPPYDVLLSQLGAFRLKQKTSPIGSSTATATSTPGGSGQLPSPLPTQPVALPTGTLPRPIPTTRVLISGH